MCDISVCVMCFRCVGANILLLTQAFRRKFIIPDFEAFASNINQLYYSTQRQIGGHVSSAFKPLVRGLHYTHINSHVNNVLSHTVHIHTFTFTYEDMLKLAHHQTFACTH